MTSSTDSAAERSRQRAENGRAPGARARVPDFFIVGNPKCGTTALYEMLKTHPQIYMPELKEPWFLASDMRPRFQPPRSASPPQSLEEYLALFADARDDQRAGEASSAYLISHDAAAQIAELQPDARVIAILREPASFLRSLHLQLLRTHVESVQDLREAIALEPARRKGDSIPRRSHRPRLLMYSDHVRYVEHLRRYHAAFPREQVLVLIYDDFQRDNEATVRQVRRFLGVEEDLPVEVRQANTTVKRMRSQQLDELVNVVSVGRGPAGRLAKAAVKTLLPNEQLRSRALRATHRNFIYGKPSAPDEEVMLELRRRFKADVQAASEYLDRDLVSLWGYDSLD